MARFAENVLKEYKKILKRKTPTKDVFYRIRVVERRDEGVMTKLVDIRQYNITEKRFGFTESGIYLNRKELDHVIECLITARKEFFNYGRGNQDNRS